MLIVSLNHCTKYLRRNWEEGDIVYIVEAREMHLLNEPCSQILRRLEQCQGSVNELEVYLHSVLNNCEVETVHSLLHEILDSLVKIGIVEVCEDAS